MFSYLSEMTELTRRLRNALPVVAAEAEIDARGLSAPPFEVADGVVVLSQETGSRRVATTMSYLLLGDDVHVVDPGEDTEANLRRLEDALAAYGRRIDDVASVIVTHFHHDHLGLARRLRARSGSALVMHEREQSGIDAAADPARRMPFAAWGVPSEWRDRLDAAVHRIPRIEADTTVTDGDVLAIGDGLRVVGAPGHTEGHIVLHDPARRLAFLGDHVLPAMASGVGERTDRWPDPLGSYINSLGRVAALEVEQALPGHGYRFTGLAERAGELRAHHGRRSADVAARLDELDHPTLWELAAGLRWSAGWESLQDSTRISALWQTELHVAALGRDDEVANGADR
jgi:glyoxylase-like metal-dependent hydrolase (beta-lactamase superfamily II)